MTEEKKTWEDLSIEESFDYLDQVLARLENKDSSLEEPWSSRRLTTRLTPSTGRYRFWTLRGRPVI